MREGLARYAHEAWSAYMAYFLEKCEPQPGGALLISASYVAALRKQITTSYIDLTEQEQEADRDEADKMLALMGERKLLYWRLKRVHGAIGYVSELLIGRLGITLHARIEQRPHVAPTVVFELRGWVIKQ